MVGVARMSLQRVPDFSESQRFFFRTVRQCATRTPVYTRPLSRFRASARARGSLQEITCVRIMTALYQSPAVLQAMVTGIITRLFVPHRRLNGLKPYGRNPPDHGLKPHGLRRVQSVRFPSAPTQTAPAGR